MDREWVLEERKIVGQYHREWRATTSIHLGSREEAIQWFIDEYLAGPEFDSDKDWQARLVEIQTVHRVLATTKRIDDEQG
jgi:hypothetical protein